MFRTAKTPDPVFTDTLELDLDDVEPSMAGPKRPQDRVPLARRRGDFAEALDKEYGKKAAEAGQARAGRGQEFRHRPWRRGDRRHHLLHQHLQPVRDDRRRAGGARRRVKRGLSVQALGQDLAGAGLPGGHRISRQGRAAEATSTSSASISSAMAAPPASAIPGRCPRRSPRPSHEHDLVGRRGAVGQPQFRGPGQSRGARQLSRLAAAGGGLCAGRLDQRSTSPPSRSATTTTASRSI